MPKCLESPVAQFSAPPGGLDVNVVGGKAAATLAVVALAVAGTEYTHTLPAGARSFAARLLMGKMEIRFAASGPYKTVSPGSVYDIDGLSPDAAALTLYVKSTAANDTLQVETWV
jgi:hypothetical protein